MSLEPGPGGLIRLTEHLALVARPVIPFCLDPRDSQCQSGSAYFEILIRSDPEYADKLHCINYHERVLDKVKCWWKTCRVEKVNISISDWRRAQAPLDSVFA